MSGNQKYQLSTVKNALDILQSFSLDEPEKKVTDLANSLGLGKSTVSRLLSTLASSGFVMKDAETQKYRLGLSILHLNSILTSSLEIKKESADVLEELVAYLDETAQIGVMNGEDIIYLNKAECKHPVQILPQIGRRIPAFCTSSGRVILAYREEEVVKNILERTELKRFTHKTITDPAEILGELEVIRKQGYALSFEELREGVASISAPIRDYTGAVIYVLTVIGPSHRLENANLSFVTTKIIQAADEISERMGYIKALDRM